MGMTIAQKILKAHLVDGEMVVGQEIGLRIDQTLTQDALRILRMVRFAAELGFAVEPGTWECARAHVRGLADISKERIRDEFVKILMADTKYGNKEGVLCGLHMLKELGAFSYIKITTRKQRS